MSQIFGAELLPRKRINPKLKFLIGFGWACSTTPQLDKTFHRCLLVM